MRQLFALDPWQRKTFVFLLALVVLTLFGPFGTYTDMNLFERLVYWTMVLLGAGSFIHFSVMMTLSMGSLKHMTRTTRVLLGACIAAIPSVGFVSFVERVMRPPGLTLDLESFIVTWTQIALIGALVALLEYLQPQEFEARTDDESPAARTLFHDRLPHGATEDIISLTMRDHYVEVVTQEGKHLILLRLGEAMRELDGIEGLQVHRSHWVARRHMKDLRRSGHRAWVTLSDGRELSVSKTYLSQVKAALGQAS